MRTGFLTFLTPALLLALAAPAAAQPMIHVGQTVEDSLSRQGSSVDEEGRRYNLWAFRGQEGDTYLVTLRSEDFDAYLRVGVLYEETCAECWIEDDDSGGGLDAQVVFVAPADGTYVIRARSVDGGMGRYQLTLDDGTGIGTDSVISLPRDEIAFPFPIDSVGGAYVPLRSGEAFGGVLEDEDQVDERGAYSDGWVYEGRAGETVSVQLRSREFMTHLSFGVWSEGRWEGLAMDDDGGGGTEAELTVTLPETGFYTVRAAALHPGATGAYELLLVSREDPAADGGLAHDAAGTMPGGNRGPLQPDEWLYGRLEPGDPQDERGAYSDEHAFVGLAGQVVVAALRSEDFDAHLTLGWWGNGGWEELARNDDGPDGTNSEIRITLPSEGLYALRASSLHAGTTGAYQLFVTSPGGWPEEVYTTPETTDTLATPAVFVLPADERQGGSLDPGDSRGENGAFYEEWEYTGFAGERVVIDLSSGDFDALLAVGRYRDGVWEELAMNDDGPDGTDSRVELTLPEDGRYIVRAGALYQGTTGFYRLRLSTAAASAGPR